MINPVDDLAVITGIGLVSPSGNTLEEYWKSLVENQPIGERSIEDNRSPHLKSNGGRIRIPEEFDSPVDRILALGIRAINGAIRDRGGIDDESKIGLVFGSGLGLSDCIDEHRENLYHLDPPRLGQMLAEGAGISAETVYFSNACCASSQAISHAKDLLELADFDLVISGGLDAYSSVAYSGFRRLFAIDTEACRPFDANRRGIMIGEGAVFFTMEKMSRALSRSRTIRCVLAGTGITNDAYHMVQIKPDCQSIFRATDIALHNSGTAKNHVDLVVAHGTGTKLNDKVEAFFIREYFQDHLNKLWVTAPKGMIGHTGGACGAFSVLTAIGAMEANLIPPVANTREVDTDCLLPLVINHAVDAEVTTALVNTFAFGGTNVQLVCKKWQTDNRK